MKIRIIITKCLNKLRTLASPAAACRIYARSRAFFILHPSSFISSAAAFFILHSSFFISSSTAAEREQRDEPIRAVWMTTIGGLDWPRTYATNDYTRRQQQNELIEMLDTLKRIGINTVLLQTRVRGTVIYPSKIEPWDACLSGTPGQSPGYDPLQFAIDECHRRGIELHAWVVTIPVGKWNGYGCKTLRRKYPQLIKQIDGEGYMDPEKAQTGDIIASVCNEIVRNYDIDGIHLDYIRYPDKWKIRVTGDKARENITSIVRKVNKAVRWKKDMKLSCSPIGKYSDLTRYSSHGWNARGKGQDAQAWLREGLMDQLYPMMYFQGDNFYPFAIDWMEHAEGKEIAAGLGIYFLDRRHGNWTIDEVKRQMYVTAQLGMGVCFFRARFLYDNTQGIYDFLRYEFGRGVPLWSPVYGADDYCRGDPCGRPHTRVAPTLPIFTYDRSKEMVTLTENYDGDYLFIETLQGRIIATKTLATTINVADVPEGMYYLRTINRKRCTHRIGCCVIMRRDKFDIYQKMSTFR